MAKKTSFLQKIRLLTLGAKSPVPKRKRKILKQAEKEITALEKEETPRTRGIAERVPSRGRYSIPSDIEKRKRAIARRARQSLLGGK